MGQIFNSEPRQPTHNFTVRVPDYCAYAIDPVNRQHNSRGIPNDVYLVIFGLLYAYTPLFRYQYIF
jgi:hypothetical protein